MIVVRLNQKTWAAELQIKVIILCVCQRQRRFFWYFCGECLLSFVFIWQQTRNKKGVWHATKVTGWRQTRNVACQQLGNQDTLFLHCWYKILDSSSFKVEICNIPTLKICYGFCFEPTSLALSNRTDATRKAGPNIAKTQRTEKNHSNYANTDHHADDCLVSASSETTYFFSFSSCCCFSFSRSIMASWASFRSPSSFLLALSRSIRTFFSCSSEPSSWNHLITVITSKQWRHTAPFQPFRCITVTHLIHLLF